jgi:hypothetical protein
MNDYIDANELFKQKKELLNDIDLSNKERVCSLLRKQFSEHLLLVAKTPLNAGELYFSLKTNDLFDSASLISNNFVDENLEYFEKYLNHEFELFNYTISLMRLEFNYAGSCLKADYEPKSQKSNKPSFWKSLFRGNKP